MTQWDARVFRATARVLVDADAACYSSAQVFPKNLLLNKLPATCDILCLHPMFGPESGKNAWTGLPLVYDRVRVRSPAPAPRAAPTAAADRASRAAQVGDDPARERRCSNFLRSFEVRAARCVP